MPTGTRLVSAVFFAVLGYFLASLVHAELVAQNDGNPVAVGPLRPLLIAIGGLVGWVVMGKRGGDGMNYAVQGGILTSASLAFWAILLASIKEMVEFSMKQKDGDVSAAILQGADYALGFITSLSTVVIIGYLLLGGALGGWIAEKISHRWP